MKAGKLVMLRRGVYRVNPPYAQALPHPFVIANRLRRSSYVSLQSALAYYGMIPEHTPVTLSVTTARPEVLATPDGRFAFRHVSRGRFFGYVEREMVPGQRAVIATPEKALLDLFYLTAGSDEVAYLEELRVEAPSGLVPGRLLELAVRMDSVKVLRAAKRLCKLWEGMPEGVLL